MRDRRHKITLDVVIREGEVDGDLFVRLTLGHLRVLLVEDLLPRHEKIFHLVKQFCLWQVGVALYLYRVRKAPAYLTVCQLTILVEQSKDGSLVAASDEGVLFRAERCNELNLTVVVEPREVPLAVLVLVK